MDQIEFPALKRAFIVASGNDELAVEVYPGEDDALVVFYTYPGGLVNTFDLQGDDYKVSFDDLVAWLKGQL